jgi:hypothetical protein
MAKDSPIPLQSCCNNYRRLAALTAPLTPASVPFAFKSGWKHTIVSGLFHEASPFT